jgi:hypothetical protein
LCDGDGGVFEECEALFWFGSAHDVEEVGGDVDVAAACAFDLVDGFAQGSDL